MTTTTLAAAAAPYTTLRWAEEVARNIAGWLAEDVTFANVLGAIHHRIRHFNMPCRNPKGMALAISALYQYSARSAWVDGLSAELEYVRGLL